MSDPRVTELEDQVNHLKAQISRLLHALSTAQDDEAALRELRGLGSSPPPQPETPRTIAARLAPIDKLPKVMAPTPYTGEMKEAKDFLNQIFLYMTTRPTEFVNDRVKISFMLSYMTGKARPFANHTIKAIERSVNDQTVHYPFRTFAEFVEAFKAAFADPNPRKTAQFQLAQIVQGSRTADEYVLDFKTKGQETGYDEEALKEKFEKGLNPALLGKIYALPIMPTNLQEWMNWAMKLDRQWREFERTRQMRNTGTTQKSGGCPQTNNNAGRQQNDYSGRRYDNQYQGYNRDGNRGQDGRYTGYYSPSGQPQHYKQYEAQNAQPHKDPNAMDVDAIRQQQQRGQGPPRQQGPPPP
jgi:hypothetical protein